MKSGTTGVKKRSAFLNLKGAGWLLGVPALLAASGAQAVTFTPLVAFNPTNVYGDYCFAPLMFGSDARLHGTTPGGGAGSGVVFSVVVNGQYIPTHYFPTPNSGSSDGVYAYGGLVEDASGNYYGTTLFGGPINKSGVVYKIAPNGAETVVHAFNAATEGTAPYAGLLKGSDGNFYGVNSSGGASGSGTVYKMTPSGTVTVLHSFTGGNDGSSPRGKLIQDSTGTIWGTADSGGQYGYGTLFKIKSKTFTTVYTFKGQADGGHPYAGLALGKDGYLYGTTTGGTDVAASAARNGTVFKMSTANVLTTLHSFDYTDGSEPFGGVIQGSDGNFYGTTIIGGASGDGTIFSITSAGVFKSLYSFANGTDSQEPFAGLVQGSDGSFYGCAEGTASNPGIIFKLSLK